MKIIILIILLLQGLVYPQIMVKGKVIDEEGKPLPGANVYIQDTYDGISSDSLGNFSFKTGENGNTLLVISFIGYKKVEEKIDLDNLSGDIEIKMEPETTELNEVVISAGSFEASDEKKGVMLRPLDIVTTGAEADIYAAMETLPGTQQIGETEGLFVRGGSAAETKTIIDEMIVQKPFYSSVPDIPQRSRFSPFIFKGTLFSTGGYSAQYGQALSSVLLLNSEDLADNSVTALSIMAVGLGGAHTERWENTSLAVEGNYYNLGPYFNVQKQRTEWNNSPVGFDASTIFRHKFSQTGMLKIYSYYNTSDMSLYNRTPDNPEVRNLFGLQNNNFYMNAGYKDILGEGWTVFGGLSFSRDENIYDLDVDDYNSTDHLAQSKLTLSKQIFGKSFITFGGELHSSVSKDKFNQYDLKLNEVYAAAYTEADVFFTSKFAARIGLRGEHSKLLDAFNLAPRVSLAYKLGKYDQVNLAYGIFYQTPEKDLLFRFGEFEYERADHYILNYQYTGDNRTFRIETYYKEYDDLAKGTVDTYPYLDLPEVEFSSTGKGYAKGVDIFWRDRQSIDLSEYWISYTYIDTKRDFRNYPSMAFPTFAAPHTFSLVFKRWVPLISTSIGFTYSFASGRPYFNPNNKEFLGDRSKSYQNMSLNFSYLTNIFNSFTVIFFSVDNVLGYENIYGYRYSSDGSTRVAVTAPALRTAFIGMFISIGESVMPF